MGLMKLWSVMFAVERAVCASGSSAEPVTSVSSLNITFHLLRTPCSKQAYIRHSGVDPWVVGPVVITHVWSPQLMHNRLLRGWANRGAAPIQFPVPVSMYGDSRRLYRLVGARGVELDQPPLKVEACFTASCGSWRRSRRRRRYY
jgi:hypothetical protein